MYSSNNYSASSHSQQLRCNKDTLLSLKMRKSLFNVLRKACVFTKCTQNTEKGQLSLLRLASWPIHHNHKRVTLTECYRESRKYEAWDGAELFFPLND